MSCRKAGRSSVSYNDWKLGYFREHRQTKISRMTYLDTSKNLEQDFPTLGLSDSLYDFGDVFDLQRFEIGL